MNIEGLSTNGPGTMCYNIQSVLVQVDIMICLAGHEEATVYFIMLHGV